MQINEIEVSGASANFKVYKISRQHDDMNDTFRQLLNSLDEFGVECRFWIPYQCLLKPTLKCGIEIKGQGAARSASRLTNQNVQRQAQPSALNELLAGVPTNRKESTWNN